MSGGGTVKAEIPATSNGEENRKRSSPVDDDQEDSGDRRIGKPSRRKRAKVSGCVLDWFGHRYHRTWCYIWST